jgi:hypothetical protein
VSVFSHYKNLFHSVKILQPPKPVLFPLMPINQPLVIIVWPVPKKRGVFSRSKIPRGGIEAYAGQDERPGYPILAYLSGMQAATE